MAYTPMTTEVTRGALVLLFLGACSTPEGSQGPSSATNTSRIQICKQASYATPSLVIGTGEQSFVELESAEPVELVFGAQGGHHIEVALKATGLNPGQGEMILDDELEGGGGIPEAVGEDPVTITLSTSVEGISDSWSAEYTYFLQGSTSLASVAGLNAFVDAWDIAEAHEDSLTAMATIQATITDACGTEVSAEVSFAIDVSDIPGLYGTGYYYYG